MKSRAGDRRLPIRQAQAETFAFCDHLFSFVTESKGSATLQIRPDQ